MKHSFNNIDLDVSFDAKAVTIKLGDRTAQVEVLRAEDGKLDLLIDGERATAYVSGDNARRWVTVNGQTFVLTKSLGARRGGHAHHAAGELTAPMPGQVRAVNVREGDTVTKGQTLIVLEAMKMEIRIHAPHEGVVKRLSVEQGQSVEREQTLIEITES